jgi:predicted RND superfamily exporter protein
MNEQNGNLVIRQEVSKTNIILIVIIILLLLLLGIGYWYSSSKMQFSLAQIEALTDTLKITKDKYGRSTATIGLIQSDVAQFKRMALAREDSLGRELQKLINQRTISATIVTQAVKVNADYATSKVVEDTSACYAGGDSLGHSGEPCNPTYILNLDLQNNPYRRGMISANRDSFHLAVKFPEKLTFIQEKSKFNLFKPTRYTSSYTNSNPDVEITGMRTFTVKCDCKAKSLISFGFGNLTGFGAGFLAGRLSKQ